MQRDFKHQQKVAFWTLTDRQTTEWWSVEGFILYSPTVLCSINLCPLGLDHQKIARGMACPILRSTIGLASVKIKGLLWPSTKLDGQNRSHWFFCLLPSVQTSVIASNFQEAAYAINIDASILRCYGPRCRPLLTGGRRSYFRKECPH